MFRALSVKGCIGGVDSVSSGHVYPNIAVNARLRFPSQPQGTDSGIEYWIVDTVDNVIRSKVLHRRRDRLASSELFFSSPKVFLNTLFTTGHVFVSGSDLGRSCEPTISTHCLQAQPFFRRKLSSSTWYARRIGYMSSSTD